MGNKTLEKHKHTLSRTTLVGFFRISVKGLASDFLEESADWPETHNKTTFTDVIKMFTQDVKLFEPMFSGGRGDVGCTFLIRRLEQQSPVLLSRSTAEERLTGSLSRAAVGVPGKVSTKPRKEINV